LDLVDDDQVDDEEAEKPRWIDTQSLEKEDFQNHGEMIRELLQNLQFESPRIYSWG